MRPADSQTVSIKPLHTYILLRSALLDPSLLGTAGVPQTFSCKCFVTQNIHIQQWHGFLGSAGQIASNPMSITMLQFQRKQTLIQTLICLLKIVLC